MPAGTWQVLPHPVEQHFETPTQSLSELHVAKQELTPTTAGQVPGFATGGNGEGCTQDNPIPFEQHLSGTTQSSSSLH